MSVRTRIVLLFMLAALGPLVLGGLAFLRAGHADAEALLRNRAVDEARALAELAGRETGGPGRWFTDPRGLLPSSGAPYGDLVVLFRAQRDSSEYRLLFGSPVPALESALAASLMSGSWGQGGGSLEVEGRYLTLGIARIEGTPWQVATVLDATSVVAPFRARYLLFGILGLWVGLAMVVAVDRVTRPLISALSDLADATNEIGQGDLFPWLPLPADDEIGRLTLATSEMVERLNEGMRAVEKHSRLAAVGELASHLAHEIRNPLSSIHMNLQSMDRMAQRGMLDPEISDMVRVSLKEVKRLDGVVGTVLEMGRARTPVLGEAHLHDTVRDALDVMLPEFARSRIRVTMELDAPRDRVYIDSQQIRGVLLNLFVNSVEAQPEGGLLKVRSANVRTGSGPKIRLWVEDGGPGVPRDLMDEIFQPFYTTKQKGSGIGLAMAWETLERHDGDLALDLDSGPDVGASFYMTLPLLEVPEAEADADALSRPASSEHNNA
jgi:signal transduction histidine kinase